MVDDVVLSRAWRAMNHENLVKRCASSQNLQAGAALASIRRRCEKHDPVGRHREVVRLLRMTDELLLVFGVDRLSATRIAFVRCFLGHLLFLQVREKSASFSQSTGDVGSAAAGERDFGRSSVGWQVAPERTVSRTFGGTLGGGPGPAAPLTFV